MVFNLELDLKGMKELIGWKNSDRKYELEDYGLREFLNNIKIDKETGKVIFPFKTIITYPEIKDYEINTLFNYYKTLKCKEIINNNVPIPYDGDVSILSEPLSNVLYYSKPKKGKLIIENYHADPFNIILRISAPETKGWDYKKQVGNYSHLESMKNTYGRMGFYTFKNSPPSIIVSYDNGGRDTLILFKNDS